MASISILDCTLRDGGYCNRWRFGKRNIKKIMDGLMEAGIDIIECGFLTDRVGADPDVTRFSSLDGIATFLPEHRDGRSFVCMVNYGEYELSEIPEHDGTSVDGIRVAFHKKDMIPALELCRGIKEKGYNVFIQAMVSLNYTDDEFLNLIRRVNEFEPHAFYIVDSFGVMKRKDLVRLFYLVEHNLCKNVMVGFHSHNNMQLSYSNAQALADIHTERNIIIDSSVYGMGRGAGNLNTELFVEYLNDTFGKSYRRQPLLEIIDTVLEGFYRSNGWGYSLPNYLSARHNVHPNYAGYLDSKKTLTVADMDAIFAMMDRDRAAGYDEQYIEELYEKYMEKGSVQEEHLAQLKERIGGKEVLVIAPGQSSAEEKDKVLAFMKREGIVSISINFDYPEADTDFIFLSNLRRFGQLDPEKRGKCIITSNIPAVDVYLQTRYADLTNHMVSVRDNAGLMLIRFLIGLEASTVWIAGMDGYSSDPLDNYAYREMNFYNSRAYAEAMNVGMTAVLREYGKKVRIGFVTSPRHVRLMCE